MRNGQVTPIPPGGNLTRSLMSSSLPTLPSFPSDQFCDIMETRNPPAMQMESVRRRESGGDALYGPGGYGNVISRIESHELSTRKRMFEELARIELEATERDAPKATRIL